MDTDLEIAEIIDRLVKNNGPAVVFDNVNGCGMPVVANLFGSLDRVAWGLGIEKDELEEIGEFVAYLQRPDPS